MDRKHLAGIAAHVGLTLPPDWAGLDAVWPILERMRKDGAVVIIKLDGERTSPNDNGPYTVLASGRPLAGTTIRTDAHSLEDALTFVISRYAEKVWGVPLGPER